MEWNGIATPGKTMLGDVGNLFFFKSLLKVPSNVFPLLLKQTFPPIVWIFTEGDGIESRLPFKIFSTLTQQFEFHNSKLLCGIQPSTLQVQLGFSNHVLKNFKNNFIFYNRAFIICQKKITDKNSGPKNSVATSS